MITKDVYHFPTLALALLSHDRDTEAVTESNSKVVGGEPIQFLCAWCMEDGSRCYCFQQRWYGNLNHFRCDVVMAAVFWFC
eukprot:15333279-Ditylum_brightwellii.AAC.1